MQNMQKIIIYTDGASRNNPGEAGAGAYITDGEGKVIKECTKYLGIATNNFAEYEAIIIGLEAVRDMFMKAAEKLTVEVRMDSELACKQLNGLYRIKQPALYEQYMKIKALCAAHFPNITFVHIRREKNKEADRLSNEAIDKRTDAPESLGM